MPTCVSACMQCMYPARHSRASYHDVCLADSRQHTHKYTDRFSTVICRCGLSQLYSRHSHLPGVLLRDRLANALGAITPPSVFWPTITALPRRSKSLRNDTGASADNALSADGEPNTRRITWLSSLGTKTRDNEDAVPCYWSRRLPLAAGRICANASGKSRKNPSRIMTELNGIITGRIECWNRVVRARFAAAAVSTWRQCCVCILNKHVSVFDRLRVSEMHRHVFTGIAVSRYVTQ